MSENQFSEPVAFAVLLDVTLEWVDVSVKSSLIVSILTPPFQAQHDTTERGKVQPFLMILLSFFIIAQLLLAIRNHLCYNIFIEM